MEFLSSNRELTKILFDHASGVDEEFNRKLQEFDDKLHGMVASALKLGIEMGIVRECNVHVVSSCIIGTVKEVIYTAVVRSDAKNNLDLNSIVDETLKYGSQGIVNF